MPRPGPSTPRLPPFCLDKPWPSREGLHAAPPPPDPGLPGTSSQYLCAEPEAGPTGAPQALLSPELGDPSEDLSVSRRDSQLSLTVCLPPAPRLRSHGRSLSSPRPLTDGGSHQETTLHGKRPASDVCIPRTDPRPAAQRSPP